MALSATPRRAERAASAPACACRRREELAAPFGDRAERRRHLRWRSCRPTLRPKNPCASRAAAISSTMAKRRKTEAPVVDSLATVSERWPGREDEVARLFRLLRDEELAPGSLFVHGPSGGGKSGIVKDVLAALAVPHAVVDCVGCSTPRALYESALNQLHGHRLSASNGYANWATCEREAAFAAALRDVLAARGRVCLVPRTPSSSPSASSCARRCSRCPTCAATTAPSRSSSPRRSGATSTCRRASPTSSPSPSPATEAAARRDPLPRRRRRSPRSAAAERRPPRQQQRRRQ